MASLYNSLCLFKMNLPGSCICNWNDRHSVIFLRGVDQKLISSDSLIVCPYQQARFNVWFSCMCDVSLSDINKRLNQHCET
ncbi:hypothetical protein RIF29_29559 [Crotalaria pallida]|uniref:Uncharacterized protein n=1 Tax=Crotalaria pallida TaxID=3830 RepID=A0AAN9EES7_CROPI